MTTDFPQTIPQHPVTTIDAQFDSLGLSQPIVDLVKKIGFVNPTPIQAAVIPIALTGRDVIGLAQTGSGKTASAGQAATIPTGPRVAPGLRRVAFRLAASSMTT